MAEYMVPNPQLYTLLKYDWEQNFKNAMPLEIFIYYKLMEFALEAFPNCIADDVRDSDCIPQNIFLTLYNSLRIDESPSFYGKVLQNYRKKVKKPKNFEERMEELIIQDI